MVVDKHILVDIRKFVDDTLTYTYANPFEIADYIYELYLQHDRIDKLALMVQQLAWRLTRENLD